MCLPCVAGLLAAAGGLAGDPKGAWVLTTRTRYSRKGYRHRFCFYHHPGVLTTLFSNIESLFYQKKKMEKILEEKRFSEGGIDFVTYDIGYGNDSIGSLTLAVSEFDHA